MTAAGTQTQTTLKFAFLETLEIVCFRVQTLDQANLTGPLYQWDWFTWCRLIAPESDLHFEARCCKFFSLFDGKFPPESYPSTRSNNVSKWIQVSYDSIILSNGQCPIHRAAAESR